MDDEICVPKSVWNDLVKALENCGCLLLWSRSDPVGTAHFLPDIIEKREAALKAAQVHEVIYENKSKRAGPKGMLQEKDHWIDQM